MPRNKIHGFVVECGWLTVFRRVVEVERRVLEDNPLKKTPPLPRLSGKRYLDPPTKYPYNLDMATNLWGDFFLLMGSFGPGTCNSYGIQGFNPLKAPYKAYKE